jgi:sugar lactone lactonase YvrE
VLAACGRNPDPSDRPDAPTSSSTTPTPTPSTTTSPPATWDTGRHDLDSGTTTTTTVTVDCTLPLAPAPVPFTTVGNYSTSEDFDFDSNGYLGVVLNSNLVGKSYVGAQTVIAPGLGSLTSGTRVLSTGDWVIADNGDGSLIRVDILTGGRTALSTAMSWPNAIEVGSNDMLYVSDFSTGRVFRINAYDPNDSEVVAEGLDQANGVALSPDEQTLYVIESWTADVLAYDKDPSGVGWHGPRVMLYEAGGDYQGLNVDACGNLYVTNALGGNSPIIRVSADGSQIDTIAMLPTGYPPNLRFGSGVGGWDRSILYVSDRDQGRLFGLEVGIAGKEHVWP